MTYHFIRKSLCGGKERLQLGIDVPLLGSVAIKTLKDDISTLTDSEATRMMQDYVDNSDKKISSWVLVR